MSHDLIFGAAGSGKTRWTADQTLKHLEQEQTVQVLLPSQSLINEFRQRLTQHQEFVPTDRLRIDTFYSFIKMLASVARIFHREIGKSRMKLILDNYLESRETKYSPLLEQGLSDGLTGALLDYFSDLEDGAVTPEMVKRYLTGRSNLSSRLIAIHNLYIDFTENLRKNGFMSRQQLILQVANWIEIATEFEPPEAVLIDGFYDFNPAQYKIVSMLMGKSEYCGITVLTGTEKVFEFTNNAAENLRLQIESRGGKIQTLSAPSGIIPDLRQIFSDNSEPQPAPEKLRLLESASFSVEVQEIIRSVKQYLMDKKLAPEEIAVLYRGGDEYYDALLNGCRHEGIPVAGKHEEPLGRNPAVMALMQWFEVVRSDFARDELLRWLQSSYFQVRIDDRPLDIGRLDRLSRNAQIIGGRERWVNRMRSYLKRHDISQQDIELVDIFERFLNGLPNTGICSWQDHLQRFRKILDLSGFKDRLSTSSAVKYLEQAEYRSRDVRALESLLELLDDLDELGSIFPLGKILTSHFASKLRSMLQDTTYTVRTGHPLGVTLTDVQAARGHFWPRIYLAGMTDEIFPVRSRVHPLVKLEDRMRINRELRDSGDVVEHRADLREEQLLFYIALSRATDSMEISTITGDEKTLPSPFYEEIRQRYEFSEATEQQVRRIGAHHLEFQTDRTWLKTDLLQHLRQIHSLPDGAKPLPLNYFKHLLLVEELRNSLEFSEYDGLLTSEKILEEINNEFRTGEAVSPSRMEMYYLSPFQYFARYLLGLKELEEVTDELLPQDRGLLLHKIMEQFYKTLPKQFGGKVNPENLSLAFEHLDTVITREFETFESKGLPIPELLWEQEARKIRLYATNAVEFFATNYPWNHQDVYPDEFEFKFGFTDKDSAPALELRRNDELLTLRGKIDRLDLNSKTGEFTAIDYKTSRGKRVKDFFNGRALQLQVYACAAQELIDKYSEPIRLSYYSFRDGGEDTKIDLAYYEKKGRTTPMDLLGDLLWSAIDNIRAGHFFPTEGECDKYCPVKQICRCDENRVRQKQSGNL